MKEERGGRLGRTGLVVILAVSLLIFISGDLRASSSPEGNYRDSGKAIDASATFNKPQLQAPALAPEYRQEYELNSEIYRLDASQYNQYKPEQTKIEEPIINEAPSLPIIDALTKKVPLSEENKEEKYNQDEDKKEGLDLFSEKPEEEPQAVGRDEEGQKEQDRSDLKGLEIDQEVQAEHSLKPLSVGSQPEAKSGLTRNQIQLEGLSQDPQEEETIQITPEIKVDKIYQGPTSNAGNKELKTRGFNSPPDRR